MKLTTDKQQPYLHVNQSVFSIKSLSRSDFGDYVCSSSNNYGTAEIHLVIDENGIRKSESSFKFNAAPLVTRKKVKRKFTKNKRETRKLV